MRSTAAVLSLCCKPATPSHLSLVLAFLCSDHSSHKAAPPLLSIHDATISSAIRTPTEPSSDFRIITTPPFILELQPSRPPLLWTPKANHHSHSRCNLPSPCSIPDVTAFSTQAQQRRFTARLISADHRCSASLLFPCALSEFSLP
ncbi:hypothetical protein M0R45_037378 [Rubus argutus]|uniref:Secreted protein n=1 Tax=Rubus argutus TaxID=59490 RepID=A0AAW1W3C4_RUBAR